ncbi:unnamed protein product, partial [Ilex paraguariensis]
MDDTSRGQQLGPKALAPWFGFLVPSLALGIPSGGKMEVPEEDEHKYLSSLKSPSKRQDLDLLTEPEDIKYFPTLCVIASKMAYKNNLFIKDVLQKQWINMNLLDAKDFWN